MREKKKFGKRTSEPRPLPSNENLRNTFGVVNKGCDSEQIISFINKTCGKDISEQKTEINKKQKTLSLVEKQGE